MIIVSTKKAKGVNRNAVGTISHNEYKDVSLNKKCLRHSMVKRYSGEILKTIHKLEKVDYRLRKAKLDINFLVKCQQEKVIPNFLKFCLANKDLPNSVTYIKCQQNLSQTEISNTK